jgi:hypothetical protein
MEEVGQLVARRDMVDVVGSLAGDVARGWELRCESRIGRLRSTLPHELVVGDWPRRLLNTELVASWNFDRFLTLILESMLMYRAQWSAVILVGSLCLASHSVFIGNIFKPAGSSCVVCHMWR